VSISPEKIAAHKLAADRLWIIKKLGEQIEQLGAKNKALRREYAQMKAERDEAVKAEREACAKVCDDIANKPSNVVLGVAINCANAIRARDEVPR
jgi:hypothetical protein